ncbi:hypothetical protein ONS95_008073 [Cadophora gregata]|uniref:uncharacterized protein n=1 Tax=Cadophora gregata TaxID=51156 RepID=UPI0026DD033A|nr:uncharacterized protein ONS95_008073 [Cadophora gregata]KAK0126476.1 hypothetical protein ONS95_008073 [Cadophora gregata]
MATKKSHRNGMKPLLRKRKSRIVRDDRHYKIPGFAAFSVRYLPHISCSFSDLEQPHNVPIKKASKGKRPELVPCDEITEPEQGIHSLAWAASIVPQNTGFLKLPFEVRVKIYEHAIEDFSCGEDPIKPRKNGDKFRSPGWANIADETTKFYQLSRQVYVDFVGSSLLYRFKPFSFDSPTLLLNYLCVINPLHKNAIRSITLHIKFRPTCTTLPTKAFTFLSKCESLEELNIKVHLPHDLCTFSPLFHRPANSPTIRSSFDISDRRLALKRIKDCETLKSIQGLKRFEFVFVLPNVISARYNRHFAHPRYVHPVLEPSELTAAFYAEMKEMMQN